MKSKHSDSYLETINSLAEAYEQVTTKGLEFYQIQLPFEKWKQIQKPETLKKEEKQLRAEYNRQIKGQVFDIARYLLPQATKTNLAWILDARSTEFDIASWKGHPLNEIQKSAQLIENAAGQIVPSLLKYTEKNEYYEDQYHGFNRRLEVSLPSRQLGKKVEIISSDPEALDKSITMLLMRVNKSNDYNSLYSYTKALKFEEKIKILKRVTEKRGQRDEWVDVEEAFDCISITAQITSDIGAIRDLRRHQKFDRNEGIYTLGNGFYCPQEIEEFGAKQIYNESIEKAHDTEIKIRKDLPHQAQYVIPMAAYHSMIIRGGLDQIQYMIATRTPPQGHFSYRKDATNLAEEICKIHPWMIGLEKYPEGKSFEEIYNNAPLKGILRVNMEKTGLHI